MDVENEGKLKEEEKNDEESTIDGEINIINELKDISINIYFLCVN